MRNEIKLTILKKKSKNFSHLKLMNAFRKIRFHIPKINNSKLSRYLNLLPSKLKFISLTYEF